LQESRMVGKFQGRFDSSNLANLQVDNLLVRADSFAVQAQDQATGVGGARKGQAAFRVDPSRMIASIQSEPTASSSPLLKITGDVTGQMDWTIDPTDIKWHLVTQARELRAIQPTIPPRNPNQLVSTGTQANSESVLWQEPQAVVTVDGSYRFSDGNLQLPQVLMQTEWLAYGGATQVTHQGQTTMVQSQGSLTYDAARAAERLRPYTGGTFAATGQKTQPLEVTWVSAPGHEWTEALSAKSSIGWDSANVVGIDIGGAEIPLVVENGRFASKAEFPVSQGVLRWNLDGDLVSEPMVIRQTQQRVIENVAITRQMCQGWLKYVTPLLADVTSVQGNLTLDIDRAEIYPTESFRQTVEGRLHVHGANVGPGPIADQILMLVTQIRNLRRGAGATDGGGQPTSWLQLPEQDIAFAVDRGRVMHRDMKIQAGDVVLTTSGAVGLDGSLELVAGVPILKEWVDKTPAMQPLAGQMVQIPIRGTVSRPQLDSSGMIQLGQQLATSALAGAAQKQIDRGLNKLLGPLQQGGSQLPLPNLPGIPGLQIPGFGANPFGAPPGSPAPTNGTPGNLPPVSIPQGNQ
jgi:translocation and assembly module TamB